MEDGNYQSLLKKAYENEKVASLACTKLYFNASISRFYYSILQRMYYVIYTTNPSYQPPDKNSHEEAFNEFRNIALKNINMNDYKSLLKFPDLKRRRLEADYSTKEFSHDLFTNEFYQSYINCKRVVDLLVNKYGGKIYG